MTEPNEIFSRTVDSARDCPGSIDDVVQACERSWVRVEAHYQDRWHTPMAGARFRLWVNGSLELDGATLKDFADVGFSPGRPPTTPSMRERWGELGTYRHQPSRDGTVRVEIVTDTSVESEIQELRDTIHARLDGAYRALRDKMRPYQEQWQRYDLLSIEIARVQGLAEAGAEWTVGLRDLATSEYWRETGAGFLSTLQRTLDTAEEAIEGAGERIKDAYKHRELLADRAWWRSMAEGAAAHAQATVEQTSQMIPEGAKVIERSVVVAREIYNRRAAILRVPEWVVSGNVDELERFIDTDLRAIDPEMADQLRHDAGWQSIIELLHDGESASIFVVYLSLFITEVPPNFWAHMEGRAAFMVFIEAALLIIGLFLGGAGAAARIAALSARLARMGAKAARASQQIDRVMDALRAVTRMLESFADAATDLRRLGDRLLRSRRARTRRGHTRSTVHERRETERRDGRCRVCGSTSHRTPIHRRGQTDYI